MSLADPGTLVEIAAPETAIWPAGSAVARVPRSPWVRGPLWDSVWMLNALWLLPLVVWLAWLQKDPENGYLDTFYAGLTALFWIGHRFCSTWLAYCTEAYRPLLKAQPVRFIVLPIIITAGCFAVFLPADAALPWSRTDRLVALAILDYGLVTYHFASQHFGALSLYRTRAGRTSCLTTRRLDRWFALGVGGMLVFGADLVAGVVAYQESWMGWLVPDWIAAHQHALRAAGTVILLGAAMVMLWSEARAPQWSLPRVLYLLGMTAMVAVALRPRSVFLFLVIWTSQHWILATGLASQTVRAEEAPQSGGLLRRLFHAVNTRPWAVLVLLMIVSVLLLPIFEVEGNRDGGTYYSDRVFGALTAGLRESSWVPALLALGFASGFMHYLLDRSVYRMSNAEVRAAASGLFKAKR